MNGLVVCLGDGAMSTDDALMSIAARIGSQFLTRTVIDLSDCRTILDDGSIYDDCYLVGWTGGCEAGTAPCVMDGSVCLSGPNDPV
jgi:hypothetical protein